MSLTQEIKEAERKTTELKNALYNKQRFCHHEFRPAKYDPIIHPAGYSEGDPAGTMGVDWRGPCSWPETQDPRWSRYCPKCELTEYTTKAESPETTKVPVFR